MKIIETERLYPSKKEIWQKLCPEIGGTFVDGGFWKGDKVVAKVNEWTVTLDTYTISTGRVGLAYTRMRAPYINKDGFRFKLYRKSMLSGLGKLFGMQDIKVGTSFLDDKYIIQGNNSQKVQDYSQMQEFVSSLKYNQIFTLKLKMMKVYLAQNFRKV